MIMSIVGASFEIVRQKDTRATVQWLNLTNGAIPRSDTYRESLKTRADHIFHEDCGELACWWLALGDRSVISETAALADQADDGASH
jgi:hypothetical protein